MTDKASCAYIMRMNSRANPKSVKKAVNLSVDAVLLQDAKANGLNLSAMLERALSEERANRRALENSEAIKAYNRNVEERGVWSDGLRNW